MTPQAHARELIYATDTIAARVDELQYTLGEGPCVDAYFDDNPQCYPDLDCVTRTSRWPSFATEATQLGVRSLFAFPVPGQRHPLGPSGVLELYRRTAGSLTEAQHSAATASAVAIADRLRANWNYHRARFVTTREAINAAASAALDDPANPFSRTQLHFAAGMLATQLQVHPSQAFDRLRAHAYASGRRISVVAADIIAHRLTLPDDRDLPRQ